MDVVDGNQTMGEPTEREKAVAERQIKKCQMPRHSYRQAHEDAEQRLTRGERQVFCVVCRRWKWVDELCEMAVGKVCDADE